MSRLLQTLERSDGCSAYRTVPAWFCAFARAFRLHSSRSIHRVTFQWQPQRLSSPRLPSPYGTQLAVRRAAPGPKRAKALRNLIITVCSQVSCVEGEAREGKGREGKRHGVWTWDNLHLDNRACIEHRAPIAASFGFSVLPQGFFSRVSDDAVAVRAIELPAVRMLPLTLDTNPLKLPDVVPSTQLPLRRLSGSPLATLSLYTSHMHVRSCVPRTPSSKGDLR